MDFTLLSCSVLCFGPRLHRVAWLRWKDHGIGTQPHVIWDVYGASIEGIGQWAVVRALQRAGPVPERYCYADHRSLSIAIAR